MTRSLSWALTPNPTIKTMVMNTTRATFKRPHLTPISVWFVPKFEAWVSYTTAHQRIYLLPSQLVPATGAGRRSGEPLMLRNYRLFSVSFLDEKERINHQTMQNWSESSHQHTFWKQRYHRNQTGQFSAPLDVQAWLKNGGYVEYSNHPILGVNHF